MHCPDNMDGNNYVVLVAAASMILAENLDAKDTFILAEFLQNVSYQLFTLAGFKEFKEFEIHKALQKEDHRP